ncbi:sugar phosphate isomerase/epimerase family protein [Oryzifoliimicrobium ureilyticus]|uniref:sugar phosphate isomerase/epimerase family protein n=1 Tax=Oryzifoliimicrobium ureilyticus TaxID=3113724 RepID=UPI0030767803
MTAFEPALCSVTFRNLAPKEIVALAKQARLEAIEWAGDVHVPPENLETAKEVSVHTGEAGLALSYGSYVAPPTDDHARFEIALKTTMELGATNMRIWPGTRGRDSISYSPQEREQTGRLIREMGQTAKEAGVTLSLEYHPKSLTDTTASAKSLIEAIAHENVYLYWQPRPGLLIGDALQEIREIGHHISHVHVFAWDADRNRYPLASAARYWETALAAIPEGRWGDRRYAMLEFVKDDRLEILLQDAKCLIDILKRLPSA